MAKTSSGTNEDELVLRAGRDGEALGQLYDLYYQSVFRFCLYRLFSREAAEDVTSIVFLTVAGNIADFPGRTGEDFRNWLYTIAVRQANSYLRKTSRRKRLFNKAARMMQSNDAERDESSTVPDWPMLYSAILKLKPKHQTIVILRYFENLEFEQIAKIINKRPSTVRVTIHRILKKLRNHLQSIMEKEA